MNSKLLEAVAIFKELGWENVTLENVLDLPVGTTEQKKTALAGLKSGEWGEFAKIQKNTYGWNSYIDVDKGNLALFAVRVGVDPRRAVNISYNADNKMLAAIIAERGPKYASDFINYACVSRRRGFEHSASVFGNLAVQLVDQLNLDIPQSSEYMKDWSVYAAVAMGMKAEIRYGETEFPEISLIEKRFIDHIRTGAAVNVPATGPFGVVLPAGVKRGWLSREEAVRLTFSALDASVRPGDRKVWLEVLKELEVSDAELHERTEVLIPLLAMGDTALIVGLAPKLIAQTEDELLIEVLLASFSAETKKARQLVLKSALNRQCPEGAEALVPWLSVFASDTDKTVSNLAVKLMKKWDLSAEIASDENNEIQGFWQETPAVWQIPSFDIEVVSPEALTELAAKLVNQPEVIHDVLTEQFLAMANALAHENPEAARTSLRGLRKSQQLISYVISWVNGEKPVYGFDEGDKDIQPPLAARDYIVCLHLGELPCLLSTPSVVDLSIDVSDLAQRLELYKKTNTDALEADLFLALTRLNVKTKTPEAVDTLSKMDVSVRLQSGEKMSVSAGKAVLTYLDNPVKEPALIVSKYGHWSESDISVSDSMCGFPDRFARYYLELFSIFPLWGDAALRAIRWDCEVYHEQGLVLRQAVRRGSPLPPGASINLLAAQRSITPDAAEDSMMAVTEAWERGLLRPGIADITMLDWSTKLPSNLVAFASVLDGVAREGMLSVVWPILDAVIQSSLKAPRLLAGTAEFAELIGGFLPEVQFAVEKGIADQTALYLPGIRALAKRGGSSRAVSTAQKIAALLPPVPVTEEMQEKPLREMDPPFDQIWPEQREACSLIDDGVTITVDWADPEAPTRLFLFTLTLPGITDRIFQIVNQGWHYDLDSEGQCGAYAVAPDTVGFAGNKENQVWLHWDVKQKTMAVSHKRNWFEGKDGPLRGVQAAPLPASLLTVIIGLLAQDGDAVYSAPSLLRQFVEEGAIDQYVIRRAMQILLQNPVVSPAKLVRTLEKDIKLLYVLWPMLTESIKAAGALVSSGEAPPVWVNRILDLALRYDLYLVEAVKRGLISEEDAQWIGLSEIASAKSKSVAVGKAKKLLAVFKEKEIL